MTTSAIIVAIVLLAGFPIASEYERGSVFRLGRFRTIKGPGLSWIIPLIEWQKRLDIRSRTVTVDLFDGARQIAENPIALELRRMHMIAVVGAEQNTTTVLMPSDFVTLTCESAISCGNPAPGPRQSR